MTHPVISDSCNNVVSPCGISPSPEPDSSIKVLRQAQGWSREQLAETIGQTPDFIAGVESGQVTPPVAFILRPSSAYGVDPGTFLRDEEKGQIRDQRKKKLQSSPSNGQPQASHALW